LLSIVIFLDPVVNIAQSLSQNVTKEVSVHSHQPNPNVVGPWLTKKPCQSFIAFGKLWLTCVERCVLRSWHRGRPHCRSRVACSDVVPRTALTAQSGLFGVPSCLATPAHTLRPYSLRLGKPWTGVPDLTLTVEVSFEWCTVRM